MKIYVPTFDEFKLQQNEGLDIDKENKKIKINLSHNKGVDMSFFSNPSTVTLDDGTKVISIFKRTKYELAYDIDGNPLSYAMKGIKGWSFEYNISDELKVIFDRFRHIIASEKPGYELKKKYDTIVIIPSKYDLNKKLGKIVATTIKCNNLIEYLFKKPDADELYLTFDREKLKNDVDEKTYNDVTKKFDSWFIEMFFDNSFEMKKIERSYRKYLKYFNFSEAIYDKKRDYISDPEIYNKINDKNILVVDDNFDTGTTVSIYVEELLETFQAKSVTVLTMLSGRKI